ACAEARDGEIWMERHSRANRASRFLQPTQERQGAGEEILCCGMISIDLNGAAKTGGRLFVAAERELRDADENQPGTEIIVAGTETDRLFNMGLGFFEASDKNLGETDYCVSVGQVRVQRQRTFTFGDSLRGLVAVHLDPAHPSVGPSIARSYR